MLQGDPHICKSKAGLLEYCPGRTQQMPSPHAHTSYPPGHCTQQGFCAGQKQIGLRINQQIPLIGLRKSGQGGSESDVWPAHREVMFSLSVHTAQVWNLDL